MKLTRKSYKRRIVTFGVMLVLAISLISTGFAAWIISQGADANADGNVEVGLVEDKSVKINNVKFYAECYNPGSVDLAPSTATPVALEDLAAKPLRFSFDPRFGDAVGKVKFDQEAYDTAEHSEAGTGKGFAAMRIRVTGEVAHAKMLKNMTLDLLVTDGVKAAETAGFIVLPTYAYTADKATYTLSESELTIVEDAAKFDFTVEIKWGAKFHEMNPSDFFDTKEFEGPEANPAYNYTLAEVRAALEEIRGTVYGVEAKPEKVEFDGRQYNAYDAAALAGKSAPKFTLTITAIAK